MRAAGAKAAAADDGDDYDDDDHDATDDGDGGHTDGDTLRYRAFFFLPSTGIAGRSSVLGTEARPDRLTWPHYRAVLQYTGSSN